MPDTSLFMPDTITAALQANLAAGLRALADALDAGELDGRFFNAVPGAGGRSDDRLHLRIVFDVAAPVVRTLASASSISKLAGGS